MENRHSNLKELEEAREKIFTLDLLPVKSKLAYPVEGNGWPEEVINSLEIQYKRFLFLTYKYGECVPTKEIDEIWHAHILDTRKYAEDCKEIFGRFVHHFPYFGLRGEEDAENLKKAFELTRKRYREEFGEELVSAIRSTPKTTIGSASSDPLMFMD